MTDSWLEVHRRLSPYRTDRLWMKVLLFLFANCKTGTEGRINSSLLRFDFYKFDVTTDNDDVQNTFLLKILSVFASIFLLIFQNCPSDGMPLDCHSVNFQFSHHYIGIGARKSALYISIVACYIDRQACLHRKRISVRSVRWCVRRLSISRSPDVGCIGTNPHWNEQLRHEYCCLHSRYGCRPDFSYPAPDKLSLCPTRIEIASLSWSLNVEVLVRSDRWKTCYSKTFIHGYTTSPLMLY